MTIRVLVVDDSSVMRTLLARVLGADPEIEVVGTAEDAYAAREMLVALKPDVMTLDVEMPRMDGLSFLAKVMQHFPTRTVMISSLTAERSEHYFRALELGAVDVVGKPAMTGGASIAAAAEDELRARVKTAARARLGARPSAAAAPVARPAAVPGVEARRAPVALPTTTRKVIAVASSTGGTEALKRFLPSLPAGVPGILIVQHMPPVFTKAFATHLAALCAFEVREAVDGDRVRPGLALLAPGDRHMIVRRVGLQLEVRLTSDPLLHGVRPAADHLLHSVAQTVGADAIGVVLTGMGRDGADGLLAMRKAGAYTIAQDEESSVVYGMPRAAAEAGAASVVAPLSKIGALVVGKLTRGGGSSGAA